MVPPKYLLTRQDKELLRKFEIKKQVFITLFKLNLNVFNDVLHEVSSIVLNSTAENHCIKLTNIAAHSSAARKNKPFKCQLCTYSGSTKNLLQQHSWTHLTHKRLQCEKCSYQTNIKSNLVRHLLSHTTHKPFVCQFCKRRFALKKTKNSHEIICLQNPKQDDATWVANQKRFQCKFCSQKMVTKSHLTQHMRTHTKEQPFQCDACDYAAASSGNLQRHVESKHNPNRRRNFSCELCQKMFFSKGALCSHIRIHTKEYSSDAVCEFCKRQFLWKQDCNRHQITCKSNPKQSDEKWVRDYKFKCDLCDYATTVGRYLKIHIMSHTGQRPFKCPFCQYGTTTEESLFSHLMRHTKEKPHKCPHCDFTACHKSQVIRHVKRHHSRSKLK